MRKIKLKDYLVKRRIVKIANVVNCIDCGREFLLKDVIYSGPTVFTAAGFRCLSCEPLKWYNV